MTAPLTAAREALARCSADMAPILAAQLLAEALRRADEAGSLADPRLAEAVNRLLDDAATRLAPARALDQVRVRLAEIGRPGREVAGVLLGFRAGLAIVETAAHGRRAVPADRIRPDRIRHDRPEGAA